MPAVAFPSDFLWGAATSSHQVEGHNTRNDWWAWEQAGHVKESSGAACDQYRRFAGDFDLAAQLGHNAHRFSIEWSRIEPEEGVFDEAALAHYVEVVRALRQRRLEPIVTLHHFTNPQWLAAKGGWTNRLVVERFARYTERVARALGDQVRYWLTVNEPMVYVNMHYLQGIGPPGARDMRQALRVIEHLIRAHGLSARVLHAAVPSAQVSQAVHLPVFVPCRRWFPPDRWVTALTDRIFNQAYLEAITEGPWRVPGVAAWRIPEAARSIDFVGVNFYARQFVRMGLAPNQWAGVVCGVDHHPREVVERSSFEWDVCPEAFTRTLVRASRLNLPLLVTENGTWMEEDARRWQFIARHVAAMAQAMQQGARLMGYLYWSLLDNFEWAHGFTPRFGLIEVDYATQARRVRESGRRFADLCRTNRLVV
jgi:beta-glucosidase